MAAYRLGGQQWEAMWPEVRDRLLRLQRPDGGWPAGGKAQEPGRVYATALATLTLSVPQGVLPMHGRKAVTP